MSIKTMELQIELIKQQKEFSEQRHKQKMKELSLKLQIEKERKDHTLTKTIEVQRK